MPTLLTPIDEIPSDGSYLVTVEEDHGGKQEVILVTVEGGVRAWKNFCLHETDQRLDRGDGVVRRENQVVCPRHGSTFDVATGQCEHGPAAGTVLVSVDIAVRHGQVYLTDDGLEYLHDGGIDEDSDPESSSHLRF